MFITRRRFEKEIEKAKRKALEKERTKRWLEQRLEHIDREQYRMFDTLSKRIRALEGKNPEKSMYKEEITDQKIYDTSQWC